MPEDHSVSLQAGGHTVTVQYPYDRHGLKGKVSNGKDKNAINVSAQQNSEQ